METYNRRELLRLVEDWTVANKSNWQEFAKVAGVNLNSLNTFKSQFNGNASITMGDTLASFFRGKFKSSLEVPKALFVINKATSDAAKRKKTEKEKRRFETRRAIEDIQDAREIKKEFELH